MRRRELEAEIKAIAADEPCQSAVGRLLCLRGVKVITAMILISEIYDYRRFASAPAFTAYLGLVPSEYSLGGPGAPEARRYHQDRQLTCPPNSGRGSVALPPPSIAQGCS